MECVGCKSEDVSERSECTAQGYRRFRCRACGKQFNERSAGSLNRTQYPSDVIALVVLWRLRYKLAISLRLYQRNKAIEDSLVDAHQEVTMLSESRQRPHLSNSMNGHIYLAQEPPTRKRRAILVSVDDTKVSGLPRLRAPRYDAQAISAALLATGFSADEVVQLHNPDRNEIETALQKVGHDLVQANLYPNKTLVERVNLVLNSGIIKSRPPPANTLLFFFYSGHGLEFSGDDYIVPRLNSTEADGFPHLTLARDFSALTARMIPMRSLAKQIEKIAAASILILDTNFRMWGGLTANGWNQTDASARFGPNAGARCLVTPLVPLPLHHQYHAWQRPLQTLISVADVIFQSRLQWFAKVLFNGPLRRRSSWWLHRPTDGRPSLSRVWYQRNRKLDAAGAQGWLVFSVPRRLQRHWVVSRCSAAPSTIRIIDHRELPLSRYSRVSEPSLRCAMY
jgi:hypothetical protein